MKPKRAQRSFVFFDKERKRTQERCALLKRTFAQPEEEEERNWIFSECRNVELSFIECTVEEGMWGRGV